MRHLRGTSSSPEPGERVGRWFTVSSLFPSLLSRYPRSAEVERAQDLPFAVLPGRADLSSWFRQSIYEQADDRCTPACLLACLPASLLFCFFAGWMGWLTGSFACSFARSLARSCSTACLLARACLLWLFVKSKQPAVATTRRCSSASSCCTASPSRWPNDRDRRVENQQPGKPRRWELSVELSSARRDAPSLATLLFKSLLTSWNWTPRLPKGSSSLYLFVGGAARVKKEKGKKKEGLTFWGFMGFYGGLLYRRQKPLFFSLNFSLDYFKSAVVFHNANERIDTFFVEH